MRLLALTHLSTRYFPREVRDEAREVFGATVVPRDFDAIEIPFPERGRARPRQGAHARAGEPRPCADVSRGTRCGAVAARC